MWMPAFECILIYLLVFRVSLSLDERAVSGNGILYISLVFLKAFKRLSICFLVTLYVTVWSVDSR